MSNDNVLVGADGRVWRIDVGGSLRFRAQGAEKTQEQWNRNPVEIFTLRDKAVNAQMAAANAPLSHGAILDQAEAFVKARDLILAKVPATARQVMEGRFQELEKFVEMGRHFIAEGWSPEYTGLVQKHSLFMRAEGLIGKLPKELLPKSPGSTQLLDENGVAFDSLRGSTYKGGLNIEFEKYVNSHGGKASAINDWASSQASSSWSKNAQAMKAFVTEKMGAPASDFYWRQSHATAAANLAAFRTRYGASVVDESFAAQHAFTYEILRNVSLPNQDKSKMVMNLIRTEARDAIAHVSKLTNGQEVTITRGAADSFSLIQAVNVHGIHVTMTPIPYTHIIGTYLPHKGSGDSFFLGDGENEFVAVSRKISTTYYASKQGVVYKGPVSSAVPAQPTKSTTATSAPTPLSTALSQVEMEQKLHEMIDWAVIKGTEVPKLNPYTAKPWGNSTAAFEEFKKQTGFKGAKSDYDVLVQNGLNKMTGPLSKPGTPLDIGKMFSDPVKYGQFKKAHGIVGDDLSTLVLPSNDAKIDLMVQDMKDTYGFKGLPKDLIQAVKSHQTAVVNFSGGQQAPQPHILAGIVNNATPEQKQQMLSLLFPGGLPPKVNSKTGKPWTTSFEDYDQMVKEVDGNFTGTKEWYDAMVVGHYAKVPTPPPAPPVVQPPPSPKAPLPPAPPPATAQTASSKDALKIEAKTAAFFAKCSSWVPVSALKPGLSYEAVKASLGFQGTKSEYIDLFVLGASKYQEVVGKTAKPGSTVTTIFAGKPVKEKLEALKLMMPNFKLYNLTKTNKLAGVKWAGTTQHYAHFKSLTGFTGSQQDYFSLVVKGFVQGV
jgi:hypothetical protein